MKVLVTGGAGFIGRRVCRALAAGGHQVVILDNFSTGKNTGLENFTVVKGDIRNLDDVRNAMRGCAAVVHLAALVSVPVSIQKPQETQEINVQGFGNVLSMAEELKLQGPVIFASSAAVYGELDQAPVSEDMATGTNLLSPYAESKWQNEQQAKNSPLTTIGLRFFNVYGLGQDPRNPYSGVLSILADAALGGRNFTIFGDGEQTRDYVHVDDVAQAIVALLKKPLPQHSIFNVGSGTLTSLNELVRVVGLVVGNTPAVTHKEPRPGDVKKSGAKISALREILPSWRPRALEGGLRPWLQG